MKLSPFALAATSALLVLACGASDKGSGGSSGTSAPAMKTKAGPSGSAAENSPDAPAGRTATAKTGGKPVVVLRTGLGDISVELYPDKAPISVENFLQYVDDGFYDGTVFHRVVPNFVIQGGGMLKDGSRKPTRATIKNEAENGLVNDRGTLSMARTSAVDSATSQFFVNLADNDFLNHGSRDFGYAVFGRVTDGMDVVDAIAKAGASANVEIREAVRQE